MLARLGLQPLTSPPRPAGSGTLRRVEPDQADLERRRAEWERRQRRLRRAQDAGLVVLTLGVLLLAYVALVASGR